MYSSKGKGLYIKKTYRGSDKTPYFKLTGNSKYYNYVVFMDLYSSLVNVVKDKFNGMDVPNIHISQDLSRIHRERTPVEKKRFSEAKDCLRDIIFIVGLSQPYSESVMVDPVTGNEFTVSPFTIDSEFLDNMDVYRIPMYKKSPKGDKRLIHRLATIKLMEQLCGHFGAMIM